jgi:CheY-like chemotaxis protein
VASAIPVEFERRGRRHVGVSQDFSRGGLFVRTEVEVPIGEVVALGVRLPGGALVSLLARAAHRLMEEAARSLGRSPGVGFALIDPESESVQRLHGFLDEMARPRHQVEFATQVLVADPNPRLLERMATALRECGFSVEEAFDGADACSACLERPPDILIVADDMAGMDGWTVAETLKSRPKLADTLVALTSGRADDLTRLRAYRLGVSDFLAKPFTDEELLLRMERLAGLAHRREAGRVVLRGRLSDLRVGTLLTLLDYERKSGILMVRGPDGMAKIFVSEGRVQKIESSDPRDKPFATLRVVLEWQEGSFEFVAAEVLGKPELERPTQYLLLEHERLKDEETA